jgi:hypothetical protein
VCPAGFGLPFGIRWQGNTIVFIDDRSIQRKERQSLTVITHWVEELRAAMQGK